MVVWRKRVCGGLKERSLWWFGWVCGGLGGFVVVWKKSMEGLWGFGEGF